MHNCFSWTDGWARGSHPPPPGSSSSCSVKSPWALCPNLPEKSHYTVESKVQWVWLLPKSPEAQTPYLFCPWVPQSWHRIWLRVGIKWCLGEERRKRGWKEWRGRIGRKSKEKREGVGKGHQPCPMWPDHWGQGYVCLLNSLFCVVIPIYIFINFMSG